MPAVMNQSRGTWQHYMRNANLPTAGHGRAELAAVWSALIDNLMEMPFDVKKMVLCNFVELVTIVSRKLRAENSEGVALCLDALYDGSETLLGTHAAAANDESGGNQPYSATRYTDRFTRFSSQPKRGALVASLNVEMMAVLNTANARDFATLSSYWTSMICSARRLYDAGPSQFMALSHNLCVSMEVFDVLDE